MRRVQIWVTCRSRRLSALLCALALSAACDERAPAGAGEPKAETARAPLPRSYPPGRWRFATGELEQVALKVSHIAVRHRDSTAALLRFRGGAWNPDAPVMRSRDEARQRVRELAGRLQKEPGRFAALARESSDDPVTRDAGGSLGVVNASRLPVEFLDAIAALKPGEISRPIETRYGFHLLHLEPTPAEQKLAASRIVIAYAGAEAGRLRPGRTRNRSRAQALELARRIAVEARADGGASFDELVERHSDSADVDQRGDIGVWSTYAARTRASALEAIAAVEPLAVTDPVDSAEGYQVFRRMPVEPREAFAATYVQLEFAGPEERAGALARMREVIDGVREDPSRFDDYREDYCCQNVRAWTRGRGPGKAFEDALRALRDGEIAQTPIETADALYLVRRVEAPPPLEPPVVTHLPDPEAPDLDELVRATQPHALVAALGALSRSLPAELEGSADKRERLAQHVSALAAGLPSAAPDRRVQLLEGFWRELSAFLSPSEVALLRAAVLDYAKGRLLQF